MYRLLALYESGGSSRQSFCAEHGLAPHTFDYWRRKYLLDHPRQSAEPGGGFRQLLPPAAPGFGYFARVRHRDGHEIEFGLPVESGYLRALLSW